MSCEQCAEKDLEIARLSEWIADNLADQVGVNSVEDVVDAVVYAEDGAPPELV